MAEIATKPLFTMRLRVTELQPVGDAPGGQRVVGVVAGGTFEGARLKGEVLTGGSDWIIVRTDGAFTLDVRLVLKTDDGALIGMTYKGLRHGSPEILAKVAKGEPVDPAQLYFRTACFFETASEKYDWINRIIALGIGHRPPEGPVYEMFELL
jgi:hypothetical protein